jgi:serine/threonine-protein kinase
VKPANILLGQGEPERAYLIDFGLGRDLDAMTSSGARAVCGTVVYMAPEKLAGRPVDETLCDVYALGATAFEAVTLRPLRAVPEGMPRQLWASYLAKAEPPRLSTILPRLPVELGAILARAMARDPKGRHESAGALAEDLEHFASGTLARERERGCG